jgi:hypothetical protein
MVPIVRYVERNALLLFRFSPQDKKMMKEIATLSFFCLLLSLANAQTSRFDYAGMSGFGTILYSSAFDSSLNITCTDLLNLSPRSIFFPIDKNLKFVYLETPGETSHFDGLAIPSSQYPESQLVNVVQDTTPGFILMTTIAGPIAAGPNEGQMFQSCSTCQLLGPSAFPSPGFSMMCNSYVLPAQSSKCIDPIMFRKSPSCDPLNPNAAIGVSTLTFFPSEDGLKISVPNDDHDDDDDR